ncbi:MAG: TldD/PmbA family protein [Candidatus Fermentibacteraceae bacterium]|nr:TldD/PmbA family protein [Candidatus Fermentibacteraceae bacterium]MBN2607805.1 TldD/PmbA family protein [Candidatus Fermentibacteraceae bacterium]
MTDIPEMRKLLELAARVSDQAEVFHSRDDAGSLSMRNGKVTEMSATIQSGYALRMIRDGMIGTAYTKNLLYPGEMVDNALASMKGKVQAGFSFPGPADIPEPSGEEGSLSSMGFHDLHSRSIRVLDHLSGKVKDGQVDVAAGRGVAETRIMNTSGLDVRSRRPAMYIFASLLFPNTETGVRKLYHSSTAGDFPLQDLDGLVDIYRAGLPEVDIPSGRMKVMFTPDTMYTLLWRLSAAASGRSFHNRISPLQDKRGRKVLSKKFTLYGDPTDPEEVNRRFFDDEGVPTGEHTVFKDGVFRNLVLNLDYADKLGEEPSGTGYRGGMWGGETISMQPSPSLNCSRIAPGDSSMKDMIAGMDRGVMILGVLGAHSGNILNGDFSVGLNPGYYVEGGEIRGRVKDGMVAGNVYQVLKNISAVEDRLHETPNGGRYPAIVLDDVSVAAK